MSGLIYKAKNFAERAHAAQVRKYSGEPYAVHLLALISGAVVAIHDWH